MLDPRSRWAGRAAFLAGLALWLGLSRRLLPYGFHDLRYLFALRDGYWSPAELVHPAFVPLLAGLRAGLGVFGYRGDMLFPLELTNIAAAALSLTALYGLGEALGAGPAASALSVLMLTFSRGFWEGALRPDPYSLAAATTIAALVFLLSERPRDRRLRLAMAGAAAGAAVGFHAAALALIPACVWTIRRDGEEKQGTRDSFLFLGAAAAVAGAAYAAFVLHYGISLGDLRRMGAWDLFRRIEQRPFSSIYTSRDPLKQARDFVHALLQNGAGPSLILGAAAAVLTPWLKRGAKSLDAAQGRALRLAGASSVLFALFFLINNSNNGFIDACLLPLPIVLMFLAHRRKALGLLFVPAALAVCVAGARRPPAFGPQGDPLYREALFLSESLRRGDVLVVPGKVFPEATFLRDLDVLEAGDGGEEALKRLEPALRQGRRALFASGAPDDIPPAGGEPSGAQKFEQVFWFPDATPAEARKRAADVRRALESRFAMDCDISSPQGWGYCRLGLKEGDSRVRRAPEYAPPPEVGRARIEASAEALDAVLPDRAARTEARVLLTRLADVPADPYFQKRLAALLARGGGSDSARDAAREARLVRDLDRAQKALGEAWLGPDVVRLATREKRAEASVERGLALARERRLSDAEAAFREALGFDEENLDAGMSLGAVLSATGRNEEAIVCYDKLLTLRPLSRDFEADTLAARANSLAALGRTAQVRRDRERALRVASPDWPSRGELRAALSRPRD
jgi:tetratricopeptide (TPR) repeat protein